MSYYLKAQLAVGLLAGSTLPVFAQEPTSLPNGFYASGYGEISYLDGNSIANDFVGLEADLGMEYLFGNFGFSLGIDAFRFFDSTYSELYPAVTYRFGDHLISAGMTRPVMDNGYLDDRQVLNSGLLNLEVGLVSSSFTKIYLLQGGSSVSNIGLRWDGVYGNTKVGASYNRLSVDGSSPDLDVFSLALRHELGLLSSATDMAVFAGYETLSTSGMDASNWVVGLDGQVNRIGFGATFGDSDQALGQSLRGWIDYDITERLMIGAEALSLRDADVDFYGVTASYEAWNGVVFEASYIDQSGPGDGVTELTLRYEF